MSENGSVQSDTTETGTTCRGRAQCAHQCDGAARPVPVVAGVLERRKGAIEMPAVGEHDVRSLSGYKIDFTTAWWRGWLQSSLLTSDDDEILQ